VCRRGKVSFGGGAGTQRKKIHKKGKTPRSGITRNLHQNLKRGGKRKVKKKFLKRATGAQTLNVFETRSEVRKRSPLGGRSPISSGKKKTSNVEYFKKISLVRKSKIKRSRESGKPITKKITAGRVLPAGSGAGQKAGKGSSTTKKREIGTMSQERRTLRAKEWPTRKEK